MIFLGQKECYAPSAEELNLILGLPVSVSQIHRLTNDYGERAGALLEREVLPVELAGDEVVYAQMDGSMILTRESDWQEVKIGRVFIGSKHLALSQGRNFIRDSEYAAHLGNHRDFKTKMARLIDKYEALAKRLVFISDGASWIANWIREEYPQATVILDAFHAEEYLSEFLQAYFGNEGHPQRYRAWATDLLETGGEAITRRIEELPMAQKNPEIARAKILNYYRANLYRMDYPGYLKEKLLIGSGAIEAAHRTIAQCRLKRSGQRWSKPGAQNVLNLRVMNLSGRWQEVQELLKAA
jgi:hypothetical protein